MSNRYLLWFANNTVDWRIAEIESIVSLFNSSIKWIENSASKPYWIAELPSKQLAHQIASRSVTLKHISEVWICASNTDELHKDLLEYSNSVLQTDNESTYKINVITYGASQSDFEKLMKINELSYLPFRGRVQLKNPDVTLQYVEYFGENNCRVPGKPYQIIFGKLVSTAQRRLINDLSLKRRKFIGTTSMDAGLSLLMANQARINKGDLVMDPFVGSGSLLVAAAYFGAYVMGVDIDYLMLHGKSKPTRVANKKAVPRIEENILANLTQYGLADCYIDVTVADSSLRLWRDGACFDAIITDPPYGIREATERIGTNKEYEEKFAATPVSTRIHYPSKIVYRFQEILYDLFYYSALHLKIGGRLVTWIPVFRSDYDEFYDVPEHDCFLLISNCEQVLSQMISRRLLTYEKLKDPQDDDLTSCRIPDINFRDKYLNYRFGKKKSKTKDIVALTVALEQQDI